MLAACAAVQFVLVVKILSGTEMRPMWTVEVLARAGAQSVPAATRLVTASWVFVIWALAPVGRLALTFSALTVS